MKHLILSILSIVLISASNLVVADTTVVVPTPHQFHHPEQFIQSIQGDKDAGKQVYAKFCANCHAKQPLISLGAPRIGVKADWESRMQRSIPQMFAKIDPGLGAMPPRGGCFECSDAELKAAIIYMLPPAK